LGQALDFILKNQDQFTRPADACPEGLALFYPPTGDERAAAATWMSGAMAPRQSSAVLRLKGLKLSGLDFSVRPNGADHQWVEDLAR